MSYREACLISSSGKRLIAMVILHCILGAIQICLVAGHTIPVITMVEAVVEMVMEKMFEGGGDGANVAILGGY